MTASEVGFHPARRRNGPYVSVRASAARHSRVTLDREELADQNQDASCHRSSDFKNLPITVSRFDVVFPEPAS